MPLINAFEKNAEYIGPNLDYRIHAANKQTAGHDDILMKVHKEKTRKGITNSQIEAYLSRSVDILDMAELLIPAPTKIGDLWHSKYQGIDVYYPDWLNPNQNGITVAGPRIFDGSVYGRYQEMLRLIKRVKPKFIASAAAVYGSWEYVYHFQRVAFMTNDIKQIDHDIIIQAALSEYVNRNTVGTAITIDGTGHIPQWVWDAFGLENLNRGFIIEDMAYDDLLNNSDYYIGPQLNTDSYDIVPDITKQETKLWFYYIGRRYIDAGCESLSFSQVHVMNEASIDVHDPSHWNQVFSRLRAYADSRVLTRFLLITGHTNGLRDADMHLALDFVTAPSRPSEYQQTNIVSYPNGGLCYLAKNQCEYDIWGKSLGGITPSGEYCVHSPIMVFIDNYNYNYDLSGYPHIPLSKCYDPYHWDEISWFAMQDKDTRNKWLKYAYFVARCLDNNAYLSLPVKRKLTMMYIDYFANNKPKFLPGVFTDVPLLPPTYQYPNRNVLYNAGLEDYTHASSAFAFEQEDAIAEIFSNINNIPYGWAHHNFTDEDVYNPPNQADAISDLIFVDDDKMYYIGTGGRIYGYVKDPQKPGAWIYISPSYLCANMPSYGQARAASNLVASPDGSKILYITVDGYICGFNINNIYAYEYFGFMVQHMVSQNLTAVSDLIWASDTRLFYVAREGNGEHRVHGFVYENNAWYGVSPGYAAQVYYGQYMMYQKRVLQGLSYDPSTQRLYYIGDDSYLYFFIIHDSWHYEYFYCGGNALLINNDLKIVSNLAITGNKIFFIALQHNLYKRVFCLINNGNNNNWTDESPTWAVTDPNHVPPSLPVYPFNQQVTPSTSNLIAASSFGIIAYIGIGDNVYYYQDYGADIYSYAPMPQIHDLFYLNNFWWQALFNTSITCLTFHGSRLFYIDTSDKKIHYFSYEARPCDSSYAHELGLPGA